MIHKITIPLYFEEVAPRFDLATEVLIVLVSKEKRVEEKKTLVLPRSSADDLCHILISENSSTLICGAIEDEYYEFLKWKKIEIFDSVAGNWSVVFQHWLNNALSSGDILERRMIEGQYVQ
jgi:hypothetical protein